VIEESKREYRKAVEEAKTPWPSDETTLPDYPTLRSIAYCETGGTMNPAIHDPSGTYHGLFQFDLQTWGSVGGTYDPHLASVEEQYWRAQMLYDSRGASPWPVCGS
jgi:hypothetical protein